MNTLFAATAAAVHTARGRHVGFKWPALATIALALCGCVPATVPQAGADPADPAARVARTGYSATIAPYTSLRPATPAPWRQRNDSVTPRSKQDR